MTHRKHSLWLSLGSLPVASGFLISGLGCSPRDDIAEPATEGGGGNSGAAGDDSQGGTVATGGSSGTATGGTVMGGSSGTATVGSGGTATVGSGGTGGSGTTGESCVTGDGFLCAPDDLEGFPFASFAVSYSYVGLCSSGPCPMGETTVTMTQPESGKLCLSGRVVQGEVLAGMNLHFASRNQDGTKVVRAFDAATLGITQVALTLDTPPPNGVRLSLSTVKELECPENPLDCSEPFAFGVLNEGPVTVPIADFVSVETPSMDPDTSILDALYFQVGTGDYAFCIRDFKFLDAEGEEVSP